MLSTEQFSSASWNEATFFCFFFLFCPTYRTLTGLNCNISHVWHWWGLDKVKTMGRLSENENDAFFFSNMHHITQECEVLMHICMFLCSVLSVVAAAGGGGAQTGFSVCSDRQTTIAIIILGHLQSHQWSVNTTCSTRGLRNHLCVLVCLCEILQQSLSHLREKKFLGWWLGYEKIMCKKKRQ